jgi:transposase
MPSNYRAYQPEQGYLLPPSPSEWLPHNHLAFFISDVVEEMDLSVFHGRYEEGDPRGNQPFHPAMMLKILIYAYAMGTFSSRRIAQKIEEDVAFRVLAAGNFPQHRTICDFRQEHLQKVRRAVQAGCSDCEEQRVDQAGAGGDRRNEDQGECEPSQAMSYGRMKQEEKKLDSPYAGRLIAEKQGFLVSVSESGAGELRDDEEVLERESGDGDMPAELGQVVL